MNRMDSTLDRPSARAKAFEGVWMGSTEMQSGISGFLAQRHATEDKDIFLPPDAHALVVGQTGCGKGVTSILPTLLRYPGPAIVIDPKGEAVEVTARYRAELGHEVVVLDPMGITSNTSGAFNPLETIDIRSSAAVDEAAAIVQALMAGACSDPRDRWWSLQAQHHLIGMVLHVLADLPLHQQHLGSVRRLAEAGISDPKGLASAMRQSCHAEVRQIAHLLDISADATLGGIMAFAQSGVSFLRGELVAAAVSKTSFNLDKIVEGGPLTLYLVLPPHMLESHGRLLRTWVSGLLSLVMRRRRRPALNTLLLVDEAAALGELQQLRQAVTLLRGYGLQAITYWQDVAQLQQIYASDWQTIVNNCGVIQCFECGNLRAAEAVCELVGWKDPYRAMSLGGRSRIIHQQHGRLPTLARLADYRQDPQLQGRWDPNPFYADAGCFSRSLPRSKAIGYLEAGDKGVSVVMPSLSLLLLPTAGEA